MRRHSVTTTTLALLALAGVAAAGAPTGNSIPLTETQTQYVSRCRAETIAQYPNAKAQANSICTSSWGQIVAAGAMANTILNAAPAPGTPFAAASMRAQIPSVTWAARAVQGQMASGNLGDVQIGIVQTPAGIALDWFRNGEPIPFNLQEALHVRGATLTMLACQAFGSSEGTRVYRVTANGRAPFALTLATREAEVASQSSSFNARADFSGALPSLASLRKDGSDWSATCPH